MFPESTPLVRQVPVPWFVWRELSYQWRDGQQTPHACLRGWATTEKLARELHESLEDAHPDHEYQVGTCDIWAAELRLVRELLEGGMHPREYARPPRMPTMMELRVALAGSCCPACDVPALVMCARRLQDLEEPGNGGAMGGRSFETPAESEEP